ncbi:MAG: sigma-70 family RNA polymerase sigma factor [Bacteroidia bacterium]|nr:sigma-70 family RNA polymerase sigma factor [Bacteroidia bacterium]
MRQTLQTDSRLSEEELVRRASRGDTSAMRCLYETHIRYLTAVCSRYIADDDRVRDILQDSFTKILTSLGRFSYRGENSLRAWMTRIVVNEALGFLRRQSKGRIVDLDEREMDLPEEESDDCLHDVPMDVIMKMIRQLPDGYRTVFNLYVFGDLSQNEISGMLGIEPKTVSSQFFRAKARLLKMIKDYKNVNSLL